MTAETAVLNNHALVMATDSAVSLGSGKVYTTANKLFCMSEVAPVGLMIYHSAKFCEVPWETLVKDFRRNLGGHRFPKLRDYVDAFEKFLVRRADGLIPVDELEQNRTNQVLQIVYGLKKELEQVANNSGLTFFQTPAKVIQSYLDRKLKDLRSEKAFWTPPFSLKRHLRGERNEIETRLKKDPFLVFGHELPFKEVWEIVIELLEKDISYAGGYSGIVIGGFGDEELRPSLASSRISMLLGPSGKNDKMALRMTQWSHQSANGIYPFARWHVAGRFLTGMDPNFRAALLDFFKRVSEPVGKKLGDPKFAENQVRRLDQFMDKHSKEQYIHPLLDNLAALPKEEMADLAEALVNLESLQLRVTNSEEVVGGPVDLAVITRGEGFIWLKRKHYFGAELNPRYMNNLGR